MADAHGGIVDALEYLVDARVGVAAGDGAYPADFEDCETRDEESETRVECEFWVGLFEFPGLEVVVEGAAAAAAREARG
ncbi:hypothetical protein IFR05_003035 [Cadophora sp. M221]|nr:hypothetical protein IFR05_003035 [Cadophora sp. M221]